MKIRTGDKVQVVSGKEKDKGQISTVLKVFPDTNTAVVKGVNIVKRHMKKQGTNPGQILEIEKPIHTSNLMLICPFTEKPTRVGFVNIKAKGDAKGKKFRYSKKALKEKGGEAKDYIVK